MSVDSVVSAYQKSGSITTGIGVGLISTVGTHIIPKLPHRIFHICDFPIVQVGALTYLINLRLKNPLTSFLIATMALYFFKTGINAYAPETPSLSKLIASNKMPVKKENQPSSTAVPPSKNNLCTCTCKVTPQ